MPHPINYRGTQDDDQTRSVDITHIQPSIMEGTILVPSLYGNRATVPISRTPPINTSPPLITGNVQIPNILTCNPGQWNASPAPSFDYQWMADGVDIPNAQEQTWFSEAAYEGQDITCEVRAYNYAGEQYIVTPVAIPISLLLPIEINDLDFNIITGLGTNQVDKVSDYRTSVITGLAAPSRFDTQRSVAYFTSGISAKARHDINSKFVSAITGLGSKDRNMIENVQTVVINSDNPTALVEGTPQPLGLKNPDAKIGTGHWTTFGQASYIYDAQAASNFALFGGYNAVSNNTPYTYIYQDVEIPSIWLTDVQNGDVYLTLSWEQRSYNGFDMSNMKMEFYDSADNLISATVGPSFQGKASIYYLREHDPIVIPTNCTRVRVYAEFETISGDDSDGKITSISLLANKGTIPTTRMDRGKNTYNMWRCRFTQAGNYSGGALAELEMRATVGGADQCTGGTILKGSEGIGGLADYAFDDNRLNGGYWAGAPNGIINGLSWLGYDFNNPTSIGELDFTGRTGADSEQMPRSFYLEGTDDGITWKPRMFVRPERMPIPNISRQFQLEVPNGEVDFLYPNIPTQSYSDWTYNSAYPAVGVIFDVNVPMDIHSGALRVSANRAITPSDNMEAYLCEGKMTSSSKLMVTKIHSVKCISSAPAGAWYEFSFDEDWEAALGDIGAIIFHTPVAGPFFTSCNGDYLRQGAAISYNLSRWQNSELFVKEGTINSNSIYTATAMEVKGTAI